MSKVEKRRKPHYQAPKAEEYKIALQFAKRIRNKEFESGEKMSNELYQVTRNKIGTFIQVIRILENIRLIKVQGTGRIVLRR